MPFSKLALRSRQLQGIKRLFADWVCIAFAIYAHSQPASQNISPDLDEIIKLSQAHINDEVIVNYTKSSGKTYTMTPDDLLYLNSHGVSHTVVLALLHSASQGSTKTPSTNASSIPHVITNSPVATTPSEATNTSYQSAAVHTTADVQKVKRASAPDKHSLFLYVFVLTGSLLLVIPAIIWVSKKTAVVYNRKLGDQSTKHVIELDSKLTSAIRKWSNSIFHPMVPTNLIAKSVITQVDQERAKLLRSQFLYAERKGKLIEVPYDGREFKSQITDRDTETLWLHGREDLSLAPAGFPEIPLKPLKRLRIATGNKYWCPTCNGEGKVPCPRCKERKEKGIYNSSCSCDNGRQRCHRCNGFRELQRVIEVRTQYNVETSGKYDYKGPIPDKRLAKSSGKVIFEKTLNYPTDEVVELLEGGLRQGEFLKRQENASVFFHALFEKTINNYNGDIKLYHLLVDDAFKAIFNLCRKNQVLKHEILPIRLRFKIEDAPVQRVSYTYKGKPYFLWVYGMDRRIYTETHPFTFTMRLAIELFIVSSVVLFCIFSL